MNDPVNNILIITSSAGSGHLQAAHAKRLELMRQYPEAQIIERDILIDWINKHIGQLFTGMWNKVQTSGNVQRLYHLYRLQPLAEILFWIPIFLSALFTFMYHDIQRVFDTQPLGTSALIWAMRAYRTICGKKLFLEKLLSDLPTEKAIHFFAPIKKLTTKSKKLIKVLTSKPLLNEGQTERDFWKTHCRLDLENIQYQTSPIRPGFQKYQHHKQADKLLSLQLKTHNHHERFLMEDTLLKGSIHAIIKENVIQVSIKPDEVVLTLMLGSQPNHVATMGYIQNFIELARQSKKKYHLFVFCSHHKNQNKSLLRKVHQMIQSTENYPVNLSIIPMGIQDDTVIAPLFYRSNATLTRSGGLTSMELLATGKGKVWIHAEDLDEGQVLGCFDGMPIWERGNAEYLMKHLSAKIITPSKFQQMILEIG